MTSTALDLVTMGHALNMLEQEYLGRCNWQPVNADQVFFSDWYEKCRKEIEGLHGLAALASFDYQTLNAFLVEHGFDPKFEEFDGVGVASLLDMLVEWFVEATLATIYTYEGSVYKEYPAFSLDPSGVVVYDLGARTAPLARLKTKSGDSLWLQMVPARERGLQVAFEAQAIAEAPRRINLQWSAGITVPKVEIITEPALSWMLGFNTTSERDGYHVICQAFQMFRFRMNEEGARAKVVTGFATTRGGPARPQPLVFDKPFIGYFTQADHDELPLAAFYADTDSWSEPAGSLANL